MTDTEASTTKAPPPRLVFVCGAGHTGSTLLDLLLGSHRAAVSLGEITQLPKNLALGTACSCGMPVGRCDFWAPLIAALAETEEFRGMSDDPYVLYLGLFEAGTVIDPNHQTLLRRLYRKAVYAGAYARWRWDVRALAAFTRPLARGARNKWRLFTLVAGKSKTIVVDSSKHYLEAAALYVAAPQRTKVILLMRDGRAVFHSGLKRGKSRRLALDAWRRTYLHALPILERIVPAGDLLEVRYEALVTEPARELQRICRFVGVTFDVAMLDFRSRPHHVLSGNDMRLGQSAAIRIDESWKHALSREELDYFEARGGALNRRLGY